MRGTLHQGETMAENKPPHHRVAARQKGVWQDKATLVANQKPIQVHVAHYNLGNTVRVGWRYCALPPHSLRPRSNAGGL